MKPDPLGDRLRKQSESDRLAAEFLDTLRAEREAEEEARGTAKPVHPPPESTDDMFYGLVGSHALQAAFGTEVNPVSAAAAFMSFLSANVGRDVYLPIGDVRHHCRLYTCHVGRSGRGGKGDSLGLVNRVRRRIEEIYEGVLGQWHSGGLSTREGLAIIIHDGYKEGKYDVPPVDDKRLWVVESEFANVLRQGKRDGNTLSSALRDAWDGVSIRPAIKSTRVWASNPHIGVHACITPSELLSTLESNDLSNGFANRFLFVWAESIGVVPFPEPTDHRIIESLAAHTESVISFARGRYPETRDSRLMAISEEAKQLYDGHYADLRRPPGGERLAALLERHAPYTLRLAMLFALTDKSLIIKAEHMRAALAWIKYARGSVEYIFSERVESIIDEQTTDDAEKILDYMRGKPFGASQTEISCDLFGRNKPAYQIRDALKLLLSCTPPKIKEQKIPRNDGKPGKAKQIFIISEG